jgi:hypothetical protein
MLEFDLPILNADTPIREAFAPMIDQGKSALVCRGVGEARIVTFASLETSLHAGRVTLADVRTFDAAPIMVGVDAANSVPRLRGLSLKYGVIIQGAYLARVVSVSERYGAVYLAAPPGAKCANPYTPHYYPPNQLNPAAPATCVLCRFSVP